MADDSEWKAHAHVVRAGLRRFADEGYICWTKENLKKLFYPYSLEHPDAERLLAELAATGAAEIAVNDDSCSLRIIDPSRI